MTSVRRGCGYGYRRIHVLLEREGWGTNIKRTYRIYRELGMQLRNKTPKRRVKAKLRDDRQVAVGPNDVWAMDFVHDQLATGKKIRVLTVLDTFSRYVPALDPRFSYRGEDVVATLERACGQVGYPKTMRVDQRSEFVSRDLDLWAWKKGVTLGLSRPGKPPDNAFIEAFNGRFWAECLNQHCGCARKAGGLASIRQRGVAPRCHREQVPNRAHEIGGCSRPVTLTKAGKL